MTSSDIRTKRFLKLINLGILTPEKLRKAEDTAFARGIELERILIREYGVPRRTLLQALSEHYNCPFMEYDEKIPIPPELLSGLDGERLYINKWFPIIKDGDTVIIAANNPESPEVLSDVKKFIKAERYEFRVALTEDIRWFVQDFLHAKVGLLIGTERTGLAFWRNTMAHWRTRLACYRNDLADARTDLAFLRWGFGMIALSDTLMRTHKLGSVFIFYPVRRPGWGLLFSWICWIMMAIGFFLAIFGIYSYIKIRKSRMTPPEHATLVEVTSATVSFLEDYHFIEGAGNYLPTKKTMLARLGDFLSNHCTILYPSPASKERTHLARERNVLAAQRTVLACYRTIYARARTGLAFMRSGVAFSILGLGLIRYFGFSLFTVFDFILVIAGILMIVDGVLWYMPARKEQSEIPRYPASPGQIR
jgi:uncharacterized membrane protein YidH (DUF202 family)